jgi:translation initiation factor IF-2
MADMTVKELAKQVGGIPLATLHEQLKSAGIDVQSSDDKITEEQRQQLLRHLEGDVKPKKISLKRTTKKEVIKVPGKSAVSVVRKQRRVYVKKDLAEEIQAEEELPPVQEQIPEPEVVVNAAVIEEKVENNVVVENTDADVIVTEVVAETTDATDEATKEKEKYKKKIKGKHTARDEEETSKDKKKTSVKSRLVQKDKSEVYEDEYERRKKFKKQQLKKRTKEDLEPAVNPHAFLKPVDPRTYEVAIPDTIKVQELAQKMSIKSAEVIKTLMKMGVMATINQVIDQDTAILVVEEMGHKAVTISGTALEDSIEVEYDADSMLPRAPVITVMGHVDHGKTSLLDYIRTTKVTSSEAGGITQHIGAYRVATKLGQMTFLDTPGHAAFTAMRARGAKCTDLVILVVAADDGVMPQTIEAIQHAKAAKVPIIVAINKIDKPEADLDRVTNELSQHDLIPESWGGDVMFLPVSAKEGTGVNELLDAIVLQSDLLELKAPVSGFAKGIVIEARIDKGRGSVATLLVQTGTLKKGDIVLAGQEYGRVRAMISDTGEEVVTAGPSMPVELLGLSGAPVAGDDFVVVKDERTARDVALQRQAKRRELKIAKHKASNLEGFMSRIKEGEVKNLNIVLKADVQGSLEAIADSLEKLSNPEIGIRIVGMGVGGFNESDVNLAMASDALLIGFNVRADATARRLAQSESMTINYYSIIYEIIDQVKSIMLGKLGPKIEEKITGLAEVRDVFRSSKIGAIAGCMVVEGIIKRGNPIRVLRDNVVIYEGELESLRRFKDNVNEVKNGVECGIGVKNYNDVKPGDQIEVFERIEVKREA